MACGYSQVKGIDYDQTFASTIRATTVRIFFNIVNQKGLNLLSIDVIKAFTLALVDREQSSEMPKGFEQAGKCLRLLQSLEGTKQGAFLWQQLLAEVLEGTGFKRSMIDPCLYHLKTDEGEIILIVWVDDIAVGYSSKEMVNEFITNFSKEINCTVEWDMTEYIGLEIIRDWENQTITLRQTGYILSLIHI